MSNRRRDVEDFWFAVAIIEFFTVIILGTWLLNVMGYLS